MSVGRLMLTAGRRLAGGLRAQGAPAHTVLSAFGRLLSSLLLSLSALLVTLLPSPPPAVSSIVVILIILLFLLILTKLEVKHLTPDQD